MRLWPDIHSYHPYIPILISLLLWRLQMTIKSGVAQEFTELCRWFGLQSPARVPLASPDTWILADPNPKGLLFTASMCNDSAAHNQPFWRVKTIGWKVPFPASRAESMSSFQLPSVHRCKPRRTPQSLYNIAVVVSKNICFKLRPIETSYLRPSSHTFLRYHQVERKAKHTIKLQVKFPS